MELWIRSQNKETLIKCEKILVEKGKDSFALLNYIDTKNWFRLGNYKTKERALEVLDEIQKILEPKIIYKVDDKNPKQYFKDGNIVVNYDMQTEIQELSTYVYEMPKE